MKNKPELIGKGPFRSLLSSGYDRTVKLIGCAQQVVKSISFWSDPGEMTSS